MKFDKGYWVRWDKISGFFPQVFFDTKRDCVDSFARFHNKDNYKAMRVVVKVKP